MALNDLIMIIPGSPVLSAILIILFSVILLYLGRTTAHQAIKSLCRVIHTSLRLASRSILMAEKKLACRNKEVLLASGQEALERSIEREFHRVDTVVKRDLSGYPALQRTLAAHITQIDDDYRESSELPPPPPTWITAVEAVAKIPSNGDTTVPHILQEIHKTISNQYKSTMDEYRKTMGNRHTTLKNMMPHWRKLEHTLEDVDKTMKGLQERSKIIDTKMDEYEEILNKSDKAERIIASSAMTQFFIAGFVLLIAIGGAIINFNLISLPMSEMVGGGSYIGQFKTSDVAALVIILVEVAMGLYLMESLRITKLFPIIGSMDDKMRTRMIWITFSMLFILAGVEAALAFMRDGIAGDLHALRQSLANIETVEPANSWIPTVGQMVMGFILPFALTFVAIPLESFIHSARTVMGVFMVGFLRGFAFLLRLIGNIARYSGFLLVNIYDMLIIPPLWIEKTIQNKEVFTKTNPQKELS